MNSQAAKDLARLVYGRAHGTDERCAVFVNNFGEPFLTLGQGPHLESNLFRYPEGFVGVYDNHARLRDIRDDIASSIEAPSAP